MKPIIKQTRKEWLLEAINLLRGIIHKNLIRIHTIYDQLAWLESEECNNLFRKIDRLAHQIKVEESLCCA